MSRRIVLVTSDCETAAAVYRSLPEIHSVLMESREPRGLFLRRRARRLGWWPVLGQVAFQAGVVPFLKRLSRCRIAQIKEEFELGGAALEPNLAHRLESINSPEARAALMELQPDLIILHGTRIVSQETLCAVGCQWMNIHAGITPKYRGSHGAYWALYHGDPLHCGVTVHLVDRGIDTGEILAQALISPTSDDNFATYPWLQLGVGLRLLKEVLANGHSKPIQAGCKSQLYYNPTLCEYVAGWARGIR